MWLHAFVWSFNFDMVKAKKELILDLVNDFIIFVNSLCNVPLPLSLSTFFSVLSLFVGLLNRFPVQVCAECNKNVVQCLLHFINLKTVPARF